MIKNYFKIAWRNLMKNKAFSLINIIGITIGLSASFVMGLMIYYDYTFDNFHKDGERIYRVVTDFDEPDGMYHNSGVTLALENAIKDNTNFEVISGFYIERPSKVENLEDATVFKWPSQVIYTDPEYFEMFNYNFIAGDAILALSKPNTVVLTTTRAKLYFPKLEPTEIIGKSLMYNDSIPIKVTGVVEHLKGRTDFVFQEFISRPTLLQTSMREQILEQNWNATNSNSQLYVKTTANANFEQIQTALDALAEAHLDEESKAYGETRQFTLQPLSDIHFNEKYGIYDWDRGQASKALLRNLALIAGFLLLLGCINFINLNTAQATQRAKEIGIRKTLGSSRKQLIAQFLGETFLLVIVAAIISLGLAQWLIQSAFVDFVPQDLSIQLLSEPIVIVGVVVLLLAVTFLSGYYPAIILSKLNTVLVLKNHLAVGENKVGLRKFLTVFQFTIAQVFIIATLLVGKQINYLLHKDMGFKTEAIVSIYSPRAERELIKKERYVQQLKTIPQIKSISIGGVPPASFNTSTSLSVYKDGEKEVQSNLQFIYGDTQYLDLFELQLLAGRVYQNDTIHEIVINEKAQKTYGFQSPEDAIGKVISFGDNTATIVGVMADFYQRSLHTDLQPMALRGDWYRPDYSQFQAVHIAFQNSNSEDLTTTLAMVKSAYKSVYTDIDDYRVDFIDDTIARFYNREQKVSKLLNWATGLSILISCLGLLGLVIYTTNRRIKEIGVRKVLGASILQINTLLCKEFLVLVAIAFIIAVPIAWYGVYDWLKDFAFKTTISFWVFIVSGLAMIGFALIIISIKTLKAASVNPVNSLRSE
jgi:ABC-type antimicrobial peptide transport system permease subunit